MPELTQLPFKVRQSTEFQVSAPCAEPRRLVLGSRRRRGAARASGGTAQGPQLACR